eukprot:212360_1
MNLRSKNIISSMSIISSVITVAAALLSSFMFVYSAWKMKIMRTFIGRATKPIQIMYLFHTFFTVIILFLMLIQSPNTGWVILWLILYHLCLTIQYTRFTYYRIFTASGASIFKMRNKSKFPLLFIGICCMIWLFAWSTQSIYVFMVVLCITLIFETFAMFKYISILQQMNKRGFMTSHLKPEVIECTLEERTRIVAWYLDRYATHQRIPKSIECMIATEFLYITHEEENKATVQRRSRVEAQLKKHSILSVAGSICFVMSCVSFAVIIMKDINLSHILNESVKIIFSLSLMMECLCSFLQQRIAIRIYGKICCCLKTNYKSIQISQRLATLDV